MLSTIICVLLLMAIVYFAFAIVSDTVIALYVRMGGLRPANRMSKRNLSLI